MFEVKFLVYVRQGGWFMGGGRLKSDRIGYYSNYYRGEKLKNEMKFECFFLYKTEKNRKIAHLMGSLFLICFEFKWLIIFYN